MIRIKTNTKTKTNSKTARIEQWKVESKRKNVSLREKSCKSIWKIMRSTLLEEKLLPVLKMTNNA